MLTQTINAYAFKQYADDSDVQLYFGMFNAASQQYLDWFNQNSLAYYPGLSGALLQWVAAGLYGQPYFSAIEGSGTPAVGPLNTAALNTIALNSYVAPTETYYDITDDIFQRILTWNLYKGDGKRFCVRWLKRRIMRFILGVNGIDPEPWNDGFVVGCENTYGVSVQFTTGYLSAPTQTAPTTSTSGGTLPASTTYYFKIVAVNGFGSTTPSAEESIETGTGSTNKITVNFDAVANASAIQVWFSTTAGAEAQYFTAAGTATSFSFTTTTGATAGTIPAANTALSSQTCTVSLNQLVLSALTQLTPNILATFKALFLAPGNAVTGADWVLEKPIEYDYVVNIETSLTALGSPTTLSATGASASETTGVATVSALGGSGSYTYAWSWLSGGSGMAITSPTANATTFSAASLTSGETLTGVAQCVVTDTVSADTASWAVPVSISRISLPVAVPSPTTITAYGASSNVTSAQVQVAVTGGAGPYTFAWGWQSGGTDISIDSPATSATTFTAIGLATGGTDSGTALCTVTDSYGQQTTCTVAVSISRATPVSATTTPTSFTVLSSASSETTGDTTVTASGGIAPYTYSWAWQSGGASITIDSATSASTAFSTSGLALNTTASGVAVCTVKDSLGQSAQTTCSVSITRASAVTASASPSSVSSGGTATTQTTGATTVTASGGSGTYTYSWGWISGGSHLAINSSSSASTTFTGSTMTQGDSYSGIAKCTVTDGYGQQTTTSVSVSILCAAAPLQHTYTAGSGTETVPAGGYNTVVIEVVSPGGGGEGGYYDSSTHQSYGGEGGNSGTYVRSVYACSSGQTLHYVNGAPGTGGAGSDYGPPGAGGTSSVSSGSLAITAMTAPGGNTTTSPSGGNQANVVSNSGTVGGLNYAGTGGAAQTGTYISAAGAGGNSGLGPGSGQSGGEGVISFYYYYSG